MGLDTSVGKYFGHIYKENLNVSSLFCLFLLGKMLNKCKQKGVSEYKSVGKPIVTDLLQWSLCEIVMVVLRMSQRISKEIYRVGKWM